MACIFWGETENHTRIFTRRWQTENFTCVTFNAGNTVTLTLTNSYKLTEILILIDIGRTLD